MKKQKNQKVENQKVEGKQVELTIKTELKNFSGNELYEFVMNNKTEHHYELGDLIQLLAGFSFSHDGVKNGHPVHLVGVPLIDILYNVYTIKPLWLLHSVKDETTIERFISISSKELSRLRKIKQLRQSGFTDAQIEDILAII